MKRIIFVTLLVALAWASAGCGAINTLTGGDQNMKTVSQLWSDVPRLDGLTPSQMDMPLPVKLLMRTVLGNLGRLNPEGEDRTTGNIDWIVFTSAKTPDDVRNFYTPDRMAASGWDRTEKSTCLSGSEQGMAQIGVFCVFTKHQGSTQAQLVIIAAQDDSTRQTNVFFLRLETTATPVANNAPTAVAQEQPTRGASTVLNGPAPYGIDRRPMPGGLNLDQLLPKQVGPYTRVRLELSTNRSVQPSSIEMDGASVYATYRAGADEIFVELGVSSSAESAQEALRVAAGDAAGGEFPTDPRFGSLGTEPSYLKVINADSAFFAWTRGGYYFSADAKGGETALDVFMQAFPY